MAMWKNLRLLACLFGRRGSRQVDDATPSKSETLTNKASKPGRKEVDTSAQTDNESHPEATSEPSLIVDKLPDEYHRDQTLLGIADQPQRVKQRHFMDSLFYLGKQHVNETPKDRLGVCGQESAIHTNVTTLYSYQEESPYLQIKGTDKKSRKPKVSDFIMNISEWFQNPLSCDVCACDGTTEPKTRDVSLTRSSHGVTRIEAASVNSKVDWALCEAELPPPTGTVNGPIISILSTADTGFQSNPSFAQSHNIFPREDDNCSIDELFSGPEDQHYVLRVCEVKKTGGANGARGDDSTISSYLEVKNP